MLSGPESLAGGDDEIARVAPVRERLRESGILMSIDTRKSAVMRAALARIPALGTFVPLSESHTLVAPPAAPIRSTQSLSVAAEPTWVMVGDGS